jgi:hypothetical protein
MKKGAPETMTETPEGTLRNLLLHRLSTEQSERWEERLLLEEQVAEQLEAEENDLLDDFARGRLSADDAERVERYLLASADASRRVAFAKALSRLRASEFPQVAQRSSSSWLRISAVALGAAACLLMVALTVLHLSHKQSAGRAGASASTAATSAAASPQNSSQAKQALPFAIVLLADKVRGGQPLRFAIPSDIQQVEIQCEIPAGNAYPEYRMILSEASGSLVTLGKNLHPAKSSGIVYVEVIVDAARLVPGQVSVSIVPEGSTRVVTSFQFAVQRSGR